MTQLASKVLGLVAALLLAACAPIPNGHAGNHKAVAEAVIHPISCDILASGVCLLRPEPNDNLSVVELRRAEHGKFLRVEARSLNDEIRLVAIVNEVVASATSAMPSCDKLSQPWCGRVIFSWDSFYRVPLVSGESAQTPFRGFHVDVIQAAPGMDVAAVVPRAFLSCHREKEGGEVRCGGNKPV